jgi:hypothetical protein
LQNINIFENNARKLCNRNISMHKRSFLNELDALMKKGIAYKSPVVAFFPASLGYPSIPHLNSGRFTLFVPQLTALDIPRGGGLTKRKRPMYDGRRCINLSTLVSITEAIGASDVPKLRHRWVYIITIPTAPSCTD